ncbi:MAG: class II glutamine amidotransferase [Cyanobacteria bacterium P01_H01_bin.121]
MCQLLGMNCNVPTDICFSFEGFSARAGRTDDHQDGWGIAFFEGSGCRTFLDVKSAVESRVADLVRHYPIRSKHVIAHIRKATIGHIALENCHPFQRELWGRYWVFAHNGDLPELPRQQPGFYRPVGQTDSEQAFCLILNALRDAFPEQKPSVTQLYDILQHVSQPLHQQGIFNYLLSDGDIYFAHCSTKLCYIVREAPFAQAHLIDADVAVDFQELTSPDDRVAVIATTPLTDDEVWTKIAPGELIMFQDGEPRLGV